MKVLIHACPQRMWYVEEFLAPNLRSQGAEVEIWNDVQGIGNLYACMESFKRRLGDGATWHIQDDVLPCRDFVKRCSEYENDKVVYGFCCQRFTDDPDQTGLVHTPDAWHSFQCVRIPDEYARECAEWFFSEGWQKSTLPELQILKGMRKGDDTFFREFLQLHHPYDLVRNVKPNLVDHIDWIIGGSVLSHWREYIARAEFWEDETLVEDLKREIKRRNAPGE